MNQVKNSPDNDSSSETRASISASGWIGVAVVVLAAVVAIFVLLRDEPQGPAVSQSTSRFQSDLKQHLEIPAQRFSFSQTATYPLGLASPVSIAVGPDDSIYVAGDRAVEILTPDGKQFGRIELEGAPTCMALTDATVSSPGRLFVAVQGQIVVYDAERKKIATWGPAEDDSLLTAMAVTADDLFVADAGQRMVRRYDLQGELINEIGTSAPDRDLPGFVLPSAYFDLVVGQDESLHVVNPGMRRVEAYSFDGQLQSFWGEAGASLPKFFGCCNPAQLAILPDGRFITSEKGIPRIKVYSDVGEFQSVVAGPTELGLQASDLGDARGEDGRPVYDIAADRNGRILVLDPRKRCIRLFTPVEASPPATDLSAYPSASMIDR